MNVSLAADSSIIISDKLLSAACSVQKYLKLHTTTHNFCNHQALQIMKNDGWRQEAEFLNSYLDHLDAGAIWADTEWKSRSHYYNPITKRGYFNCHSAVVECTRYFNLAKFYIKQFCFEWAFFLLGAAVHLVQDLCVPHHSNNVIFGGHQRFEKWSEAHAEDYSEAKHGWYDDSISDPGLWVVNNAEASFDLYSFTNSISFGDCHRAAKILLPHAQKTSAGFFLFFLESVSDSINHFKNSLHCNDNIKFQNLSF